jgi:ADP-ribose pyrophosphatase
MFVRLHTMSADPNPHEETLRSERGFDGKLLHVRVDHVRLPSGRESVREVVEHPGAVAILALTANDEVILVRQWRHAVRRRLLEIPAGTREPDEATELTARRELLEETGYRAGSTSLIAEYFSSAGFSNEQMTLYCATGCIAEPFAASPDEHTEVVLVQRSDVRALLTPGGEIQDAKSLVGLYWLLGSDQ